MYSANGITADILQLDKNAKISFDQSTKDCFVLGGAAYEGMLGLSKNLTDIFKIQLLLCMSGGN